MRLSLLFLAWAVGFGFGTNGLPAQNQNLSNGQVFDGEPFLAVNPDNPRHLVVAWMSWIDLAHRFQIKTRVSFDGGGQWSPPVVWPHTVPGYSSADPCLAFGPNGRVYGACIDFTGTAPPVSGGIYCFSSTDGGLSWSAPTEVISTQYDGNQWPIDRPWIAVDRSNGTYSGRVYLTSFTLNRNSPPFRPYLSISDNQGQSFQRRYLDSTGWLAGNLNPLPLASPSVASDGDFYATFPSWELSQNLYPVLVLAKSTNGGLGFSYGVADTLGDNAAVSAYQDAKKAGLLLTNPANPNHLALVNPRAFLGDLDIYFWESMDGGLSWSSGLRVNDDPPANNRMQDLVWGDFDEDGDLVITWRDRRNSQDSSFASASEIWAAVRPQGSPGFSPNFALTGQSVPYDSILAQAGNDFMCVRLIKDTLHAVWGDTRNGKLNIWYQRTTSTGQPVSIQPLAGEPIPAVRMYPNPAQQSLHVRAKDLQGITLWNGQGKMEREWKWPLPVQEANLDIGGLSPAAYTLVVSFGGGEFREKLIVR